MTSFPVQLTTNCVAGDARYLRHLAERSSGGAGDWERVGNVQARCE